MAITNKALIELYKAANSLPLDMPLYTYAAWIKRGYQVRKGERCKHRVPMWKYVSKVNNEDGEEKTTGRYYHKTMNLFTNDQVEKITAS